MPSVKILSALLRISAVVAAVVAVTLFFVIGDKKAALEQDLLAAHRAVEIERDNAFAEKAKCQEEVISLDSKLGREKTKAASLNQQYLQSRKEISELDLDLQEVKSELGDKDREVRRLKRELIAIKTTSPSQGREYEQRVDSLQKEIARLQEELQSYQDEAKKTPVTTVTLSHKRTLSPPQTYTEERSPLLTPTETAALAPTKTYIAPAATPTPSPSYTGEQKYQGIILSVGPDKSIVAISTGSNQGLQKSMQLRLNDNRGELAHIVLSNVQSDFSVGKVLPGYGQPTRLKKGKKIFFHVP